MCFDIRLKLVFLIIGIFSKEAIGVVEKKAIFIVGAPRSGTSATTGLLQILGLYLGKSEDLIGPSSANIKGFFEHREGYLLNERILKELNSSWSDLRPLVIDCNSAQIQQLTQQVKKYLFAYFGSSMFFGFKDPRLCLLLPLYTQAAQELGFKPKIIIVLRNPEEIVASLKVSDKMSREQVLVLVRKHIDSAFKYAQNYDHVVITFDELVNNTQQIVTKLKKFLPELNVRPATRQQVKEFISKDLKHHNMSTKNSTFLKS